MKFLDFIRKLICWNDYEPEILKIREDNKDLKAKLGVSEQYLSELNVKLHNCTVHREEISKKLDAVMPELQKLKVAIHPKADYWNDRKPKARITYNGRYIPKTNRKIIPIDVRLLIMPQDQQITRDIKNFDLTIENPLKCNDGILKIYKFTRTNPNLKYSYSYDDQLFGVGELWLFPFELRELKTGDCDDWMSSMASYLIAAGVPRWRVRCVIGTTYSGFGHATIYVLGDDFETWYHLNSTTPISMIRQKTLTAMPKSNDSKDQIGIKSVWFSYNDKYAWHTFETSAAETDFKKEKAMKKFSIKPE